jgi:hypothetical protein
MPTDLTIRASDDDRQRVALLLGEHMAVGRLSLAEFDDRTSAALTATTLADLGRLVADLPMSPDAHREPARTGATSDRDVRTAPDAGRTPWAGWLLTGVICLVVWAATSVAAGAALSFWPMWVIGPWGLAILGRTFGGGCGGRPQLRH